MKRLVSKAVAVEAPGAGEDSLGRLEPLAPSAFTFEGVRYEVAETLRTWRSTKADRGAKRGAPCWWLYSIDEAEGAPV